MIASVSHRAISAERADRFSRWLSAFGFKASDEGAADRAAMSSWLVDCREMRSRASALAEKPPLTSY
jgi:hypothetical protein